MSNKNGLGKRVAIARGNKKMSQSAMCKHLKLTQTYLSHVENGKTKSISLPLFGRICELLEVTPNWLLTGKE